MLYVGIGAVTSAIVMFGFWSSYYGPLLQRSPVPRPALVHFHAAVFTGWLVLFLLQAALAVTGRVKKHLRLGRVGAWYGAALIATGVGTALVMSAAQPPGQRALLLWVALLDMANFAGFFAAALWFRRKPELHKRLMTVAAVSLAIAAIARLDFFPPPPLGRILRYAVWSIPILIGIVYDTRRSQRLHPVYLQGLVVFAFRVWSPPLVVQTSLWQRLTESLLALVT